MNLLQWVERKIERIKIRAMVFAADAIAGTVERAKRRDAARAFDEMATVAVVCRGTCGGPPHTGPCVEHS